MTTQKSNPTAAKLRRLISKCPVCSADLSRHRFAELATTEATEDNNRRIRELLGFVRQHEWGALTGYKDFRSDKSTVVVYSITGPHGGGMVALIRDSSELYEPAELCLQEELSPDEMASVMALVPAGNWQEF